MPSCTTEIVLDYDADATPVNDSEKVCDSNGNGLKHDRIKLFEEMEKADAAENGNSGKARRAASSSNLEEIKPILPFQLEVQKLYNGDKCQIVVALLIILNFIISAIEAQVGEDAAVEVFSAFEWTFNILFGIELLVNIYANFWCPFWKNGWNIFDVFIVGVSWMSMAGGVPGITVLRLFRAFRAFRLFKRIESVRIIIVAVAASLPGVANAFVLLIIVMGIWGIMGVNFFRQDFPELFGNFSVAMLTLFQVMTFDSWVSGVTRPICLYYNTAWAPLYFITYIFVSGIVMTNVVIAILLEKFQEASEQLAMQNMEDQNPEERARQKTPKQASQALFQIIEEHFVSRIDRLEAACAAPLPAQVAMRQAEAKRLAAEALANKLPDILPGQSKMKDMYESPIPQVSVAALICINFVVSAAKVQILAEEGTPADDFFTFFEWILNTLFLIELVVNVYANWFFPFWKDAWNIFDFLIVAISWMSMVGNVPGISVLRLFRAFRVFRLFKRVPALRQIISGIIKSMPGVANAFLILLLVMGIWSIMGVSFFADEFPEFFATFFAAMLSMVQIMSYDSWSSGITRPVVTKYGFPSPIFFVSYVFITAIIMMNVVLAILLDKYLQSAKEFEKSENSSLEGSGPDDLAEIIANIDPAMEIDPVSIEAFEQRMRQRLTALEHRLQGPLKNFLETNIGLLQALSESQGQGCCPLSPRKQRPAASQVQPFSPSAG
eukprot:gnl/MRDRNA2_/MRDRNA2_110661_c0_seq1.p1 gnl/MRDRNA2_/MRDRNA2_110661_c0~~gnl/MRDRNA2_/MRDRNA2_110661_c0_seq1.p1  ORF type:complete len:722 (+),score=138.59 gnl/MRDRNA2_/MRDRNA2_110661_c0_seq1:136-2301(+)